MAKIHTMPGVGSALEGPVVRTIGVGDLQEALRRGIDDFLAMPTHAFFIALIYPVLGLLLAGAIFGNNVLPLLFPLVAGFALVGPFAAVGLYELSRRRERGEDIALTRASQVLRSPSIGSIAVLGVLLVAIIQNGLNLLGVSPYAFKMVIGAFILFAISSSSISFRRLLRTS